ncbi:polyprenyl synthetase family protein [Thiorhodospira sibirica]|uniref:polyprenyl synthetase family protein n=1 Tax=Thiorhodospira sibirica TaxID=154347 RepID=UPI00022C1D21
MRIEQALIEALAYEQGPHCPPQLAAAIRYAVFPGGARVRPSLALAVAQACGEDDPRLAAMAAASVEIMHCASLIHDDLPCFDNACIRRGKPSVHVAFGERIAVLAGDALIVLPFQALARAATDSPQRLPALIAIVGRAVGLPSGIIPGQAWECESEIVLADYQRAKTGALFAAATMAGAAAAGAEHEPWRTLGECLGEAYQVADDILDATATEADIGKPGGRDAALGRPSAANELGLSGAKTRLRTLLAEAIESIPPCPGQAELRASFAKEAEQFLPKALARFAA